MTTSIFEDFVSCVYENYIASDKELSQIKKTKLINTYNDLLDKLRMWNAESFPQIKIKEYMFNWLVEKVKLLEQ